MRIMFLVKVFRMVCVFFLLFISNIFRIFLIFIVGLEYLIVVVIKVKVKNIIDNIDG